MFANYVTWGAPVLSRTALTTVPNLKHLGPYIKIHATYLSILTIKFNQFIIQ